MPEVFVNPNLPNYFVVADQVTNETTDRSYVPEYEDSKVIVFPNLKPNIDHEFWAKLPTDKYPDLKKLKSELDMTRPGYDPALLQRLKRLNLPAGLAEAIQTNIGKFYESILPAYTSIFGGYKFTRCRAV